MKEVKKAVILCGGFATRFLPITKAIPKEMFPILDTPVLHIIVSDLAKAGIEEICMIVSRGKDCILNYFDRNIELENRLQKTEKFDYLKAAKSSENLANIVYKRQYEARGTGTGVEEAKTFVGDDPFVVMFGDEFIYNEKENVVEQIIETYNKENKSVIAVKEVPVEMSYKYGMITKGKELDNNCVMVNDIVEKPAPKDTPSNIAYIGPVVLKKNIFDILKNMIVEEGKEKILTNAFKGLCKQGDLCARFVEGERYDVGDKFGFVKANVEACLRSEDFSQQMKEYILELAKTLK